MGDACEMLIAAELTFAGCPAAPRRIREQLLPCRSQYRPREQG